MSSTERTLDGEGVCVRCGAPDVHCFCPGVRLTTTDRPPDVFVFPGPKVPVTNYVDSFGWRCCLCGFLGTGVFSVEAAMKEAHGHMKSDHPDMETVNVQRLER